MNTLTGLFLLSGSAQSDTDIRYLSGFTAPDPFLYLKTEQADYLVVSSMEKGRAERQAKRGTIILTPSELGLSGRKMMQVDQQMTALMGRAGIRHVRAPFNFPAGLYRKLTQRKVNITIENHAVCPERKIKTHDEIRKLRQSQRAAVAAMDAAVSMIASTRIDRDNRLRSGREVVTSELVKRLIQQILMEHDCAASETIVAGGEQATDPHERGSGPLMAGEAIIIDIFPRSIETGYWGDITRTVCRGPAVPELKGLYLAVKTAQAAALRAVGPGCDARDAHEAAKAVFGERGYKTEKVNGRYVGFIHGTGHGVGLDIHEAPRVSTATEILDIGNVITIEPGLYYPGLGGVRIEDTVVVTEKGWRYLASCEKRFELL